MKIILIILLVLMALALYSSIGRILCSYYLRWVDGWQKDNMRKFSKILAGPFWPSNTKRSEPDAGVAFYGIFWPFGLAFTVASWIIWFVFYGGPAHLLSLVTK